MLIKVKFLHLQATKALRVGTGIALPFLRPPHWRWRWGVSTTPRPLYPRERPGTHCTGGWVSPRAGLDGCIKFRLHRNSIPGPSSPQRVAIPTELFRPTQLDIVGEFFRRVWDFSSMFNSLLITPEFLFYFQCISAYGVQLTDQ